MTELAHRRPVTIAAQVDWEAALRYLNLSAKDPKAVALRLVCDRYGLDPLLGHVSLYDGKPYVHFAAYLHIANEHPAYLGPETVREWEDETYYHATVRVHRSDREFPSERTGKSRKVKKKKDGSTYTDEDADAKAFAQALRRALRMAFNVAHPEPGEDEHDPTPAPPPVVEVARMATDSSLMPSVELVQSISTTEQAKNLVSGPAVGDRYREAVREAQMQLIGEVWADFWRAADRDSWVAVLLEARRLLAEPTFETSGPGPASAPPGDRPGSDPTSEETADAASSPHHTRRGQAAENPQQGPSGYGVSSDPASEAGPEGQREVHGPGRSRPVVATNSPASDLNASVTGPGDTGVSSGQEPPNAEASTYRRGQPVESEHGTASGAGTGPVTEANARGEGVRPDSGRSSANREASSPKGRETGTAGSQGSAASRHGLATEVGDVEFPGRGHSAPDAESGAGDRSSSRLPLPTSPGDGKAGRGRSRRGGSGNAPAASESPPAEPSDEAEQAAFDEQLAGDDTGRFAR